MVIEEKNFKTKKLIKIYTKTYQIKKKISTGIMPANHPSLYTAIILLFLYINYYFFMQFFLECTSPDQ